ncbi:hypothetical protein EI94DRAFT_1702744 [Lactarius quietus]|nr:hypothetical protein EI94DRAFT_1702744 [Lactarius quietus]
MDRDGILRLICYYGVRSCGWVARLGSVNVDESGVGGISNTDLKRLVAWAKENFQLLNRGAGVAASRLLGSERIGSLLAPPSQFPDCRAHGPITETFVQADEEPLWVSTPSLTPAHATGARKPTWE